VAAAASSIRSGMRVAALKRAASMASLSVGVSAASAKSSAAAENGRRPAYQPQWRRIVALASWRFGVSASASSWRQWRVTIGASLAAGWPMPKRRNRRKRIGGGGAAEASARLAGGREINAAAWHLAKSALAAIGGG